MDLIVYSASVALKHSPTDLKHAENMSYYN